MLGSEVERQYKALENANFNTQTADCGTSEGEPRERESNIEFSEILSCSLHCSRVYMLVMSLSVSCLSRVCLSLSLSLLYVCMHECVCVLAV